jgi:hypothetical protein
MELTIKSIKNSEQKIFPELEFIGDDIKPMRRRRDDFPWVFFAPHFYAEQPAVLTKKFVRKLQNNGNMLSVGCGPAYLEQFLVKAYDVPAKNITLCDKFGTDVIDIPKNFEFIQFDMYNQWPEFNKQFDYIIFPESIFFGSAADEVSKCNYDMKVSMFSHLLEESLVRLKPDGEMIMKGMIPSRKVVDSVIMEMSTSDVTLEYQYGAGSLLKRYLSVKR